MKTLTTFLAMTAALILLMQDVFSQEVNSDSVKAGQFYNILLSNDEWITGEVLTSDSLFIKLRQTDGTASKFSKQQVKTIIIPSNEDVEDYYADKYSEDVKESNKILKPRLSLSGGLGLTTFERSGSFPSSYVFNLEGLLYLSRNAAVRLFIDCNFMGNDNNHSYSGPGYYSYEEGGNLSLYIFTADMLLGSLKPEQKTRQYFTCGVGMFILSESDSKSVSSYGTYTYPGYSESLFAIKLGYGISHNFTPKISAGGELLYGTPFVYLQIGLISVKPRISYKISDKLGLFFEPQYTFPVAFGDFGGFYASDGYFTIKSGITLGSF